MALSLLATVLDIAAIGWTLFLVFRYRDWRLAFLAAILLVFVGREISPMMSTAFWGQALPGTGVFRFTRALAALFIVYAVHRIFSERSVAVDSLHRSETRYLTLVETIPHGVFEIDREGAVTYCNAAVEQLLGYSESDLAGRPIWELCRSHFESEELRQYVHRLLADKTSSMQHFGSFRRKDHSRVDLQMHWNYRQGGFGQREGLVAIVTDVTDRKRTERVLRLIVQGTASTTGVDFFFSLVRHLADALQVNIAFAAEFTEPEHRRVRYLALWNGERFEDVEPFAIAGTAGERVLTQNFVSIPQKASELFPDDRWLIERNIEAFMALPLFAADGHLLGFMGVMHDSPIEGRFFAESILKIFASRAAAELQRKFAEEAVRDSEGQLRTIVQEMPVMMCAFDAEGNVVAWNRECEAVTGYSAEQIVGNPKATELLYPDPRLRQQVFDSWRDSKDDFRNVEWTMTTKNGEARFVEWSKTSGRVPIRGWAAWGIGVDVTDRKQAEERQRRSEARSRAVLDAIPDLMIQIDSSFRCTDYKSSIRPDSIFLVEEIIDRPLTEILPAEVVQRIEDSVELVQQTQHTQVLEFQTQGDDSRAYEVRVVRTNKGEYLCIFQDVTDRIRLQKEILEISNREQRRIGQDLHDGLGQLLTAIAFLAQALQQRLEESNVEETESAEQIVKLVYDAIAKTRGLARGLYPVQVDENGLASALQDLAADVENLYGIRCDFECPNDLFIEDQMVVTNLYRIAQEAVTNALRHGEANHIRLLLTAQNGNGMLTITDNGVGVPDDLEGRKGLGFSIMSYRATVIGGTLEVRRGPDGGTIVRCPFPRSPAEKANEVVQ